MTLHTASPCVICQVKDRIPERGLVCEPCRRPLPGVLADIVTLHGAVPILPATTGQAARVSGSSEAPLPLSVDGLDLTSEARSGALSVVGQAEAKRGNQVGQLPAATVLDGWVRDWRDVRDRGERLPAPTVSVLANWLGGERLVWACDEHPAIDEFAGDIRRLRAALRSTSGDAPTKPEHLWGPCKKCDLMTLVRRPGDDYPIQCGACGALMTEDEYAGWTKLVAASTRKVVAA